jgi:hypothetical protein
MRYVMVPVPSAFVLDVMRLVIFRAPEDDDGANDVRDEARLGKLMEEADDVTRKLILLVAKATTDSVQLRFSDAGAELDQDGEAVRAILKKVNGEALGGGRDLIGFSEEIAVRVHGNVGKDWFLVMRMEHARILRALDKAAKKATT